MPVRDRPIPPDDIAMYVGGTKGKSFVDQGRRLHRCLVHCLPADFSFAGKRILDHGCGSGRLIRHFADIAETSEFWGCDISRECIDWMTRHFQPPFRFVINDEEPPLPFDDDYFDLVYAVSVFTHLTDSWKRWLQEIRRILKPEGLALLTYMSRTAHEVLQGGRFPEDASVMKVTRAGQNWDRGGPFVYHTHRWIEENWGPILTIEAIYREGMEGFQSVALARKTEDTGHPCRPVLIQPFPYCESRTDFKGHVVLDSFEGGSWLTAPGIAVRREQRFSGWFTSMHGPIVRLEARLNDKSIGLDGPIDLERRDVADAFPVFPYGLHSGFDVHLDLSSLADGIHQLEITAIDEADHRLTISAHIRVNDPHSEAKEC